MLRLKVEVQVPVAMSIILLVVLESTSYLRICSLQNKFAAT